LPAEVLSLTVFLQRHETPIKKVALQTRSEEMAYRYQRVDVSQSAGRHASHPIVVATYF
jgi:hypothetical protein